MPQLTEEELYFCFKYQNKFVLKYEVNLKVFFDKIPFSDLLLDEDRPFCSAYY